MTDKTGLEELIKEQSQSIAAEMADVAKTGGSEENIRHECNKLFEAFRAQAGIKVKGEHEYYIAGGRIDSKYGLVIFEYKKAGEMKGPNTPGTQKVIDQLKTRFKDFEREQNIEASRIFGVGLDGHNIVFVRFRGNSFEVEGPVPVSQYAIERVLRAFVSVGANGQSFIPENLSKDFGQESVATKKGIQAFYRAITSATNTKVKTFFGEWKILFGEVCGYDVDGKNEKLSKLGEFYEVHGHVAPAEILFSVHTFYALFMKLLAAETLSFTYKRPSLIKTLTSANKLKLKMELEKLERGGIWKEMGIQNFLEGDLFSWYLEVWNEEIAEAVHAVAAKLDGYDPTTLSVEPEESRDLLKKLYQQLFPKSLRHDLGEYYTPDWLAQLVLDEVGYDGDPDKRVLDPACGSGTFLVMAINRVRKWHKDHRFDCGFKEKELAQKIFSNIIGFDLNPLAVIAARTNFLIANLDLVRFMGDNIQIPVYMCDSIMTPSSYSGLFEKTKELETSVGKFKIPFEVTNDRQTIGTYASLLEQCVRGNYKPSEFLERCRAEGVPTHDEATHKDLYKKLVELDKNNQNGVWARIIKNAFAPLFVGKVDYVVGNPPWINWESLPEGYREASISVWAQYGLRPEKGQLERMKGGKKDFSMLFVYVSMDCYLPTNGKLGFVITQTVFKTRGAGDGFRRFKINNEAFIRPIAVQDMTDFQPFEGATNKTAVFVATKTPSPLPSPASGRGDTPPSPPGRRTEDEGGLGPSHKKATSYPQRTEGVIYPVPYIVWRKTAKGEIATEFTLEEVLKRTKRVQLAAEPVDPKIQTSPWLTASKEALIGIKKIISPSYYKANEGVNTGGLNGVYWVRVLETLPNGNLRIENLYDVGKIKVEQVETVIEPELIYPLLRGRDVKKWLVEPSAYIIITQDKDKQREGLPESEMKIKFPKTYAYLNKFHDKLAYRPDRKYYPKDSPFYTMRNVASYTMAPWKVMWPEVGHTVRAGVCGPNSDNSKPSLPDHTIVAVSCSEASEAHFICSLLNSSAAQLAISSYIVLHPSPHVLEHVAIPKFDPKDKLHLALSSLSKRAHGLAKDGKMEELAKVEGEIDQLCAKLWGLSSPELSAIQAALLDMSTRPTQDDDPDQD